MKLAVLGATGPSGLCFVQQALDKGHDVIALVRNPGKLQIKHDQLQVEKVDIFSDDSLRPHFVGCDTVISCLGTTQGWCSKTPITFYLESMEAIVKAMGDTSVTRLICMTSICTKADRNSPRIIEWVMRPLMIGQILASMAAMEDYLFRLNGINFTIVRPPELTNGEITGQEVRTADGQIVPGGRNRMPRADVTMFMLSLLENDQWDRKAVAISL